MADITIPIPAEALEAAMREYNRAKDNDSENPLHNACLAMLKAWPMADIYDDEAGVYYHLPLPQESGNE